MRQQHSSKHRPRIAIVGSAGRLGTTLAESFGTDHTVIRLARQQLDLANPESIQAALGPLEYDRVIITGALTAVDYCETHPEEARRINALAAGEIAEISAAKNAHVTFISTDMVYDGEKSGLYSESDPANPISVYGATKLEGENRVLAASPANLVIRISWVYGPGKQAFPEWIINKACSEADVTLPGDKTGCTTSCVDLAEWMHPLLSGPDGGPSSGVFNLCNSSPCSWREWGQFCIDEARDAGLPVLTGEITGVPVASVAAFVARRPVNSAMDTAKFTESTGIQPRHWHEATRDFLRGSECFAIHRGIATT